MTPLLEVERLHVTVPTPGDPDMVAVDGVSFAVARGEFVALVGESGCGKSLTALAIPRLLPSGARLGPDTSIRFDGVELTTHPESAMRPLRGARIAMIFQDPLASLNPVMRVADQIVEAIRAHGTIGHARAEARAIELLSEVGIADPSRCAAAWPHQLSGGMRQRVMIAIALAGEPDLLVADEPTTALDATVQAQILELLDTVRRARGMAMVLITHDLAIVAGRADRVLVMYAGRIVEAAATTALFTTPAHPYTRALLATLPRLDRDALLPDPIPGAVPSPGRWPTGCRFHPRCTRARAACHEAIPPLDPITAHHHVACWVASDEAGA